MTQNQAVPSNSIGLPENTKEDAATELERLRTQLNKLLAKLDEVAARNNNRPPAPYEDRADAKQSIREWFASIERRWKEAEEQPGEDDGRFDKISDEVRARWNRVIEVGDAESALEFFFRFVAPHPYETQRYFYRETFTSSFDGPTRLNQTLVTKVHELKQPDFFTGVAETVGSDIRDDFAEAVKRHDRQYAEQLLEKLDDLNDPWWRLAASADVIYQNWKKSRADHTLPQRHELPENTKEAATAEIEKLRTHFNKILTELERLPHDEIINDLDRLRYDLSVMDEDVRMSQQNWLREYTQNSRMEKAGAAYLSELQDTLTDGADPLIELLQQKQHYEAADYVIREVRKDDLSFDTICCTTGIAFDYCTSVYPWREQELRSLFFGEEREKRDRERQRFGAERNARKLQSEAA